MKPKETLEKIQKQPESTRKAILWGVTIVVGAILFFWWFFSMRSTLEYNQQEQNTQAQQNEYVLWQEAR